MESKNIAAIEIASSKIKGAVGQIGPDGKLTVLALEEIPATNNVRYGRVQNIREVSGAVNEIVRRLEASPAVAPGRISSLAISIGGRSLAASPTKAALQFPNECEITESHVQRLIYEASRDFMGEKNIEAMVPRNFFVNNTSVHKAVGTFGETLRGEFMMLTCGKETRQNLDRLKLDTVTPDSVYYIVRPLAIADLVLTDADRELGCALVDIGAETSAVSVYKDGTLAFLSTIPMGSRLITLDLMAGLGVTEVEAETYKTTLTAADAASNMRPGDPDAEEVNSYVRARAGEIAANILNQIERSGLTAASLAKIVLVGGGARLAEFATQISAQCKTPVETAGMPHNIVFRVAGGNRPENIDIVSLLSKARTSARTFITYPVRPEAAPRVVADILPEEEEEEEVEAPAASAAPAPAPAPQTTAAYGRRLPAEDDDALLDDDPEEEEEEEQYERPSSNGGKRGGIFGFLKRGRKEEAEPVDDDDSYDVYDDEPEDEPEEPQDDDPDNYKKITSGLNKLRDRMIKIFEGDENYE